MKIIIIDYSVTYGYIVGTMASAMYITDDDDIFLCKNFVAVLSEHFPCATWFSLLRTIQDLMTGTGILRFRFVIIVSIMQVLDIKI